MLDAVWMAAALWYGIEAVAAGAGMDREPGSTRLWQETFAAPLLIFITLVIGRGLLAQGLSGRGVSPSVGPSTDGLGWRRGAIGLLGLVLIAQESRALLETAADNPYGVTQIRGQVAVHLTELVLGGVLVVSALLRRHEEHPGRHVVQPHRAGLAGLIGIAFGLGVTFLTLVPSFVEHLLFRGGVLGPGEGWFFVAPLLIIVSLFAIRRRFCTAFFGEETELPCRFVGPGPLLQACLGVLGVWLIYRSAVPGPEWNVPTVRVGFAVVGLVLLVEAGRVAAWVCGIPREQRS